MRKQPMMKRNVVNQPYGLLAGCFIFLLAGSSLQTSVVYAQQDETPQAVASPSSRPNILFIMSDDHGYQALSCYGSRVNETPNLDRIANEGMRFDRCFVTNSICGPARAVILTGKYSHLNGFTRNGNRFNGEQQNVAKLLQDVGYNTAVVGKWHLGTDPTGFDYWHILQGQGPYYNPEMLTPDGKVAHTGYTTDIITDLALDYLENRRDDDKPFFLVYQHKAPHRNWQPGPDFLTKYDGEDIPEPDTLFDDYEGRGTAAAEQTMTIANHLSENDLKLIPQRGLTDEQREVWDAAYGPKNEAFREAELEGDDLVRWMYQRYVKDYLRCVDSVDVNVGRVLDYLEETGLDENTIVIYTSDQGWYLGEHGWYDKRWMYEESFRTPFIVKWPGHIEAGTESETMVMNLDFAQTFLEAAGAEIPDDMQGRSLVPVFEGNTPDDWRTSVYYHYYEYPGPHSVRRHYGVRNQRYKLIYFYRLDEWELFDLQEDPQEMQSVYDDPAYAEIVVEMKEELERLREHYKDDGSVIDFDSARARSVESELVVQHAASESLSVDGDSVLQVSTNELRPDYKPLVVGGWITPTHETGVIAAHGGAAHGYSLFLEDGKLKFSVRSPASYETIESDDSISLGQWIHTAAVLDPDGNAQIYLNGQPSGESKKLGFITSPPADGLSVGSDGGSAVGNLEDGFRGTIRDFRIYWGPLDHDALVAWVEQSPNNSENSVSLFNGRDLTGWQIIEDDFFERHGDVEVRDEILYIGKGQPASGIVFDGEPPRIDYEISLDAKRIEGSDFFCGITFPVNDKYLSLIIGGWGGGVTGLSNLDGFSAVENETTGYMEFESDRWYAVRLHVSQSRIEAFLDDELIVGIDTDLHQHSIWWEQEPVRPLGIATWNTGSALKDIRLRRLTN